MRLFYSRLLSAAALLSAAGGCAPEVVLATSPVAGGGGGAGGAAGAAGVGGIAGTGGEPPLGVAGDGGAPGVPPPRLLADSVADFSPTQQGLHGWFYGYDNGSLDTFTQMTRKDTIMAFMPPSGDIWDCWASETAHWTQLFELGGHPNGVQTSPPSSDVLERAVRRWISSYAGDVRITGEIAMLDTRENVRANGVDASVVIDGVTLFSVYVPADDAAGLSYNQTTTVQVGSTVDFVLDPHESDDSHDLARFTAVIERLTDSTSN